MNAALARLARRIADTASPPEEAFRSKIGIMPARAIGRLLSPDLRSTLAPYDGFAPVQEGLAGGANGCSAHPLERYVNALQRVSLPGQMLTKVDRMSMANSLEVRVPFVDRVLADFVAGIPVEQRFPRWRLKGLLRDTMAGTLPPAILRRRKHGFSVPISDWFRGDLDGFMTDTLTGPEARAGGCYNVAAVSALLRDHRDGRQDYGKAVWALLMFELWRRRVLG
jgi:asparagine synthase (glutamine-hydrolysing)